GLADYIRMLAADPNTQIRLGKNARKLLEMHYTIDQAIPKYIKALGLKEQSQSYLEQIHQLHQNQPSFCKHEYF
ncbi:MAG: hypothetical protein ACK53E_13900, partial [Pseudanabaena sp.]